MSKWCGDENCLQCADKEPDPYVHLPREDYDALRAENARLREAVKLCIERLEGLKEDGITKAEQAALDSAQAALQPKGANHD